MNSLIFEADALRVDNRPGVSLCIRGGEICGLSGPSGAGKTRLLRALADLDPQTGKLSLNQQTQSELPAAEWRRAVMLIPARPRWWLPSAEAHFARDMRVEAQAIGLTPQRLQAPCEQLSSGEQNRAALLRGLSRDPQLLLLDEPTAALDSHSTQQVESLLRNWLRPTRAILLVSHDQAQLERLCQHTLSLDHHGRLCA